MTGHAKDGEGLTPKMPPLVGRGHEKTIKLDLSIARGNLALPSHFGRYQVLRHIGAGGFASVYAALDPELDAPVAVKVLAENHSANPAIRQRFVAEARVARRLGSDRLIGVYDVGESDDGRPFVVMELASRGTLRQRVVRTGRPSVADLVRLITELGACMEAIHAHRIVHRDIKPSNLLFRGPDLDDFRPTRLIEDDERLVLADFGLARDISDGASALTIGAGTEGYMAPEQGDPRGQADVRADIYAATVVVAELTTGRRPDRLDLPTAPVSTDVLAALTRGMAADREARPATATEWAGQLLAAYRAAPDVAGGAPVGSGAVRPNAPTVPLDPTRVEVPYPYRDSAWTPTGAATEVPETGLGAPVSFEGPADQGERPPPPPGLPLPSEERPPPPTPDPPTPDPPAAPDPPTPDPPKPGPPVAPVVEQPAPPPDPVPAPPRQPSGPEPALAPPAPRPIPAQPEPVRRQPSPPASGPPGEPASSAEVATARSKEHLRTARRLAKLERRQNRKQARKLARRRRRLLVINFFLSLIRGLLGALVFMVVTTVVSAMVIEANGGVLDGNQAAGVIIAVATVVGFLWGMAYFPVPRPRDL